MALSYPSSGAPGGDGLDAGRSIEVEGHDEAALRREALDGLEPARGGARAREPEAHGVVRPALEHGAREGGEGGVLEDVGDQPDAREPGRDELAHEGAPGPRVYDGPRGRHGPPGPPRRG